MAATAPPRALADRIERLFSEHVDSVFNVAYRVLWNRVDAEDVAQRTFVKALQRLGQLDDHRRERAWLLQIAYHEAIASIRKRREIPTSPEEMPVQVATGPCPLDAAIASDVAARLSAALAKLHDDERLAVVLRDVEGLSMIEVAGVLEIGTSAAKMRVHRGRGSLRRLVSELDVA